MAQPRHPALYQINTRIVLGELAARAGRPPTLDCVSDEFLDQVAALGFDWVWLLGVWQTGPAGREVSRADAGLRQEFESLLPDLSEDDICGSPFAVRAYSVHADFGGNEALARLRRRMADRGLRLLLDFVPNHTALDHRWAREHPEYYIAGSPSDLAREPANYYRLETSRGPRVLAHGRDPYFPSWRDTLQLNYRCGVLRRAMIGELTRVAGMCDGVRCDMSMLLLPEVIQRIWGPRSMPGDGTPPVDALFWPEAIAHVRATHPHFLFMAEVYWDLEAALQQQGFDYTYDKRLYDRLLACDAQATRGHLRADAEFQCKCVRFLENHDEPRAACAFAPEVHPAAAVVAYLVPGLRFFHEGQLEGRRRHASIHLRRRPAEPVDAAVRDFYLRLLQCAKLPAVRDGDWRLLECRPAWEGNRTCQQLLAFTWEGPQQRLLAAVNYGPAEGQCYLRIAWPDLGNRKFLLRDRMTPARYLRDGADLAARGLYLDMPPWCCHVFEVLPQ